MTSILFLIVLIIFSIAFAILFINQRLKTKVIEFELKRDLLLIELEQNNESSKAILKKLIELKQEIIDAKKTLTKVKTWFGFFGIVFGLFGIGLSITYLYFLKNIDVYSDLLTILNKKEILDERQFQILSDRNNLGSGISTVTILYSTLSNLLLLSFVINDLLGQSREDLPLEREIHKLIKKLEKNENQKSIYFS